MNKTWKAVLGVILIYIFGCFSGMVSTSIFFHHRMLIFLQHPAVALSAALEKRLTGNLGLDADQKEKVHACFEENLQQRKELQKQIQPQVQALNHQTIQEVTAILHPDQTELFQQNIEKVRKHFGAMAGKQEADTPSASNVQPGAPTTNSATTKSPAAP